MRKLNNLHVERFKGLEALELRSLANVNLLVGKNNTGKTTVLEALRLLLSEDPRVRMYEILSSRDEYSFKNLAAEFENLKRISYAYPERAIPIAFEALFFGRRPIQSRPTFTIRANRTTYAINIQLTWIRQEETPEEAGYRYVESDGPDVDAEAVPGFQIHSHRSRLLFPLDRLTRMSVRRRLSSEVDPLVVFLPSTGMTMGEVGRVWDTIALTDEEDEVIQAVKIIAPTLEKLVMVQSPAEASERTLMAKLREFRSPVPFKSLGEGTVHLLSIVLAMMKARNGVVLIDEIENGVHYSIQSELWKLVHAQSERLKAQVFATTHSWDCVTGFAEASREYSPSSGALFRLERNEHGIEAVRFSPQEVSIADREGIEVR